MAAMAAPPSAYWSHLSPQPSRRAVVNAAVSSRRRVKRRSPLSPAAPTPLVPKRKKVLVPIGMGTEELKRSSSWTGGLLRYEAGRRLPPIGDCFSEIFDLIALPSTCKQADEKRLYGAICAAQLVLKPWGLLRRKQTTGHPAFMEQASNFLGTVFGSSVSQELGGNLLSTVLVPVANGSEDDEVCNSRGILLRAKVEVVVASVERSTKSLASQNTTIIADKSISAAAEISNMILIILPVVDGAGVIDRREVITSRALDCDGFSPPGDCEQALRHARARSVAEGIVYEYPRQVKDRPFVK
ncbi:unnamed protein product [Spirodela intermedia]|uniref:DJ-1/PfpI domain-containing protein n=1 Tax=Spirodela intermedia TaxID=51605 RepID=A0A7I8IM46_SPIIN|nr:unnamed protein product [Spirodela intermedia]CAA6658888.1 unnamed protein product [Spirodela intermedia]